MRVSLVEILHHQYSKNQPFSVGFFSGGFKIEVQQVNGTSNTVTNPVTARREPNVTPSVSLRIGDLPNHKPKDMS